jgi:hypothetical protein
MIRLVPFGVLLACAGVLAALPSKAPGCAAAPHPDERVLVTDESALIIWDEATKTEHFIRRATFDGNAYDFGFLVPTPSKPQLDEADDTIYSDLAQLTAPKIVYETHEVKQEVDFGCAKAPMAAGEAIPKAAGKGDGPRFEVLDQKRIGDLDATVLGFKPGEGDPAVAAAELLAWLSKNGYAARPDLLDWIKIYARDKWVITAFKIAGKPYTPQPKDPAVQNKDNDKDTKRPRLPVILNSTAVRMSFKADRPYFPYREPADQRDERASNSYRLLRVFVAAKQRMAGKLGDGSKAWPGEPVWADAIPEDARTNVLTKAKLPAETAAGGWWLTEFEDRSTPRPGTDEVYFEPSRDQSAVARPPTIVPKYVHVRVYPEWFMPLVIGLPFLLVIGALVVVRYLRR